MRGARSLTDGDQQPGPEGEDPHHTELVFPTQQLIRARPRTRSARTPRAALGPHRRSAGSESEGRRSRRLARRPRDQIRTELVELAIRSTVSAEAEIGRAHV